MPYFHRHPKSESGFLYLRKGGEAVPKTHALPDIKSGTFVWRYNAPDYKSGTAGGRNQPELWP